MDNIGFLLKTYRDDYIYYSRLIDSFLKYNSDSIKLYVVAPSEDIDLFKVDNDLVLVISEDDICKEMGIKNERGYVKQQIIKLLFWQMGFCENYFCIDSDCYFISFFRKSDFMYSEDIPYTVIYDDRELLCDPDYFELYGKGRRRYNRIIRYVLDIPDSVKLFSCHGFGIISSDVMKGFQRDVIERKNMSYADILIRSPIEFTWYNYYLQSSEIMSVHPINPIIKSYHTLKQLSTDINNGITEDGISRFYKGICINSNFGRTKEIIGFEDAKRLRKGNDSYY